MDFLCKSASYLEYSSLLIFSFKINDEKPTRIIYMVSKNDMNFQLPIINVFVNVNYG